MHRAHLIPLLSLVFGLPTAVRAQQAAPPERFVTNRVGSFELPLPEEEDVIFFAVFGDRTGGPAEGVEVLAQAVDEVNLLAPELVMTVGDLVEGYGETSTWLEEMREYKSIMNRLDCPWFPVAGNHDTYWRNDTEERTPVEHDADYETHFGPLWYAFRHKSAWFLVLYTDEGHPETGKKGFRDPEEQKISPEQLAWLEATLERSSEAEHVFVFVHHPRWIGGGYGDDWERVHRVLAAAGNVKAVFAGHIHHMRYDGARDGIEYFTLATVGGVIPGSVPEAGFLHEYHLVTVRKDRLGVATFPVGSAMDPRLITGEVGEEVDLLARKRQPRNYWSRVAIDADDAFGGTWELEVENPVGRPIELTWSARSDDSRWRFQPDHGHLTLEPGAREKFRVVSARTGAVDGTFRIPEVSFAIDYLAEGARIHLPERRAELPLDLTALTAPEPAPAESVLELGDELGHVRVDHDRLVLPDGPLTVEAWVLARAVGGYQGIVSKLDGGEFALALDDGAPMFLARLGSSWAVAQPEEAPLELGSWHHLAGVFDGSEVRTYVDGVLVAQAAGAGARKVRRTPLLVGAEVDGLGRAVEPFSGAVDEVRISSVARYAGERFEPQRRHAPDSETVLLLHMDAERGAWQFDSSGRAAHGMRLGSARVVELDESGR